MARQIHIRIDDDTYEELNNYSTVSGQTIQNCMLVAIRQLLIKAKEEPGRNPDGYTFIDLFAGIGGMRIAFEAAGAPMCIFQ